MPVEDAARFGDVRAALLGIILREGLKNNFRRVRKMRADAFCKFEDGDLLRIADVGGEMLIGEHKAVDTLDEIGDVAEAAGLAAVAVNGERFAQQRLMHKIGKSAAVVEAHAGPVGVEDADDAGIDAVIAVIGHGHGFGEALGFVVNAARADGIDVAPVFLVLR